MEKGKLRWSPARMPTSGPAPLFGVFVVLWLAFALALIFNQAALDSAWQWLTGVPLILQVVLWILFLPVTLALWIWESDWSLWMRLALAIFLAITSLAVMNPKPQPGQDVKSTPSDRRSQSA